MSDTPEQSVIETPPVVIGSIYIPVLDGYKPMLKIENLGPLTAASILMKVAQGLIDETLKGRQGTESKDQPISKENA